MLTLAKIQAAARSRNFNEAEKDIGVFLEELFGFDIQKVRIRQDNLSLNSVNGIVYLATPDPKTHSRELFFKFHHEENEEALKEYYNSQLLADNNFPLDLPVYASQEPGKQILIYPVKHSRRFFDLCKELEAGGERKAAADAVAAQVALDKLCCERYIATLHQAPLAKLYEEPILQLFVRRLTDDIISLKEDLGGRFTKFYAGKECRFPGDQLVDFDRLATLRWRINGLEYDVTLADVFRQALRVMSPEAQASGGKYSAVIAHGDAHNGNVWYNEAETPYLSLFDPAFAGSHIPALLAEIKPTFHNIFAHPLWLYDAAEANSMFTVSCQMDETLISVTHNWSLGKLRSAFLESKRDHLWKPLLKALKVRDMLPENWQEYMRLALFCCPTLVMNLRANAGSSQNSHTPQTSLLGFAISIMLASPPAHGSDEVSTFFSELEKEIS